MGDGSVRDGDLQGIGDGYFQREIQDSAYEYEQRIEREAETGVGVNAYETENDPRPELLHADESGQERQRERIADVKAELDYAAVAAALDDLEDAIVADENVIPAIIDAVKVYTAIGEIMAVFEDHYGSYQETIGVSV